MIKSSNGNILHLTGPLWWKSAGHRWIPLTKTSDAELFFFDLRLNKRLSKQSRRRWFETPSHSLWLYCNVFPFFNITQTLLHDDVIKWKHFPRNWPFVREIHRSPVNFPHKGQWRGALMFSLIYVWINDWVNNREAGDLRRQHGHYDVIVMVCCLTQSESMLAYI